MQKSKLVAVLKELSDKELNRLEQFVQSPFHNQHEEVIALFQYLKKELKHKKKRGRQENALDKQFIFQQLFPKKKYTDLRVRHLMSLLLKVVEAFLAYQIYETQPQQTQLYLLEAYQQKQLNKHFQSNLKNLQKAQQNQSILNPQHFYWQYQLEKNHSHFLENQHQRHIEPNLQALNDSLNHFYLANKLKYYCGMFNYQQMIHIKYELPLLAPISQHLQQHWQQYSPFIQVYYHALLILTKVDNETHFRQFKELLQRFQAQFSEKECRNLYVLARNYCIKRLNQGNSQFIQALFDLYKAEIERGSILNDNILPPLMYKNIVAVALSLKKYDWVADFIDEYKVKLPIEYAENSYAFALARLHFEQKKYDKVVLLLNQLAYDELFLSLDAKRLLLKTYYELSEDEALYSLMDSFRAFIKRRENIAYHRTHYLNLIKFVQQLLRLPFKNEVKQKKLQAQIEATDELVEKDWLLEKVKDY